MRHISAAAATGALVSVLVLSGCAAADSGTRASPAITLPPAGGAPDYQLGGAYDPPDGVEIVARDRGAQPAEGLYSICYVNGFQTQPDEQDLWPEDLLLHDESGTPLVDAGWPDEVLLDTSMASKRDRIVDIIAPWIRGCADAGFDAVEFDNLDSFTRSLGALTSDDNTALAVSLVQTAHNAGLPAGQKNAAELTATLHDAARFDFAVAEECAQFDECTSFTDVYGDHVIAIEYVDALRAPFAEVCAEPGTPASTVLRDRDLVTPDDPDYVFELC